MNDNLEKVHQEMEDFLSKMSSNSVDVSYIWTKLRNFFIDLVNRKIILDPTTKTIRYISRIKNTSGFSANFNEKYFYKVFPSTQYKYHLESKRKEHCSNVKIRPPTTEYTSRRHNYNDNIREIDLKRFNPRRHSSKSLPAKESQQESRPNTARRVDKLIRLLNESQQIENPPNLPQDMTLPPKFKDPLSVKDDFQAIEQLASVDPEKDDNIFHYANVDRSNMYSFSVIKEPPIFKKNFQTISRRGLFQIDPRGNSEFIPIDRFVLSKAQYEMIQPIQLFSQFIIFKSFEHWKLKTAHKLFIKKKNTFIINSWNAKPAFPRILEQFRKNIFTFLNLEFFPFEDTNEHEFDKMKHICDEKIEEFKEFIGNVSKLNYKLLDDFCFAINDKYNFMISPRSIDFITAEKIPQALLQGAGIVFKGGLSISQEREIEVQRKKDTEIALRDVNHLKDFIHMCDKMMLEVFMRLFTREMKKFNNLMMNESSEHYFRVFLLLENDDIKFSPTLHELKELLNTYMDGIVKIFDTYVRPTRVDITGKRKLQKYENSQPIKYVLYENQEFKELREKLSKEIEKSYLQAEESRQLYIKSSLSVNDYKKNWPKLRETVNDPQKFIQNLTDFTQLKDYFNDLHSNYYHNKIILDARVLKSENIETLEKLIQDNNSILFRNFNAICENIIEDVKHIIGTLTLKGYSLENVAEFNLNISNAIVFIPELNKNTTIINGIVSRAIDCGDILLPVLSKSMEEVKEITAEFDKELDRAQNTMEAAKIRAFNELKEKQNEIDNKIKTLERQMKRQFSICNVNQTPSVAINDIEIALGNIDKVKIAAKDFKNIASRMNYIDFDFSMIDIIEAELGTILHHWKYYQEFTSSLKAIIDKRMIDCNLPDLIEFLHSYSEKELRSVNHVLYDKMAYIYTNINQYLPFFNTISKIEMNDHRWASICEIVGLRYYEIRPLNVLEFLRPVFIDQIDEIRDFIIAMQQRENLMKHFNEMIDECSKLSFKLVKSKIIGKQIVTFPCIYDANNICENYLMYLKDLKTNDFYETIEMQCQEWTERMNIAIAILIALIAFQDEYVSVCAVTQSLYGLFHFPAEYQKLRFVHQFFDMFMEKIVKDPLIFSMVPEPESRFNEQMEEAAFASSKSLGTLLNPGEKSRVSNDENTPITDKKEFSGEFVINCLLEAKKRCQSIMKGIHPLLEQQRQLYPRLYMCSDNELLGIIVACSNLRYSQDDFKPIFPAISKFHVSMADSERILGITNKLGETYSFSSEFIVNKFSLTKLLSKIESELKNAVKGSISDCFSTRDYTEITKLYEKYPLQSIIISESAFFKQQISEILSSTFSRNDFSMLYVKIENMIKSIHTEMVQKPDNIIKLANIMTLKLRQRDIAKEIEGHYIMDARDYVINKHIWHNVASNSSSELVTISFAGESLNYGYEMIDIPSILPLTDSEENAISTMFLCMHNLETSMCKLYSANRNLAKVFADFIGYFYYECQNPEILVSLLMKNKIVFNIMNEKLNLSYSDIIRCIENNVRQLKVADSYKEIKLTNNFLIHFETEKIPGYLMQRYRPIYMNKEAKEVLLNILAQTRNISFRLDSSKSVDVVAKAILNPDPIPFVYLKPDTKIVYIKTKNRYFFHLPEYLLTGEIIKLEDPIPITLPENIINEMEKIVNYFSEFDMINPRAQSQDYPIRPYSKRMQVCCPSTIHFIALFFTSLGETIHKVNLNLTSVSPDHDVLTIYGYRPLHIDIYHNISVESVGLLYIPEISLKDIALIITQDKSIIPYQNELVVYIENMIEYLKRTQKQDENLILMTILTKVNCLRHLAKSNMIVSETLERIFSTRYTIDYDMPTDVMPLMKKMPLVISGPESSGKRTFSKGFIAECRNPKDSILYVSPFNKVINKIVFQKLKFIKSRHYEPNLKGGILWILLFDFQIASKEIKDFVHSYLTYKSIKNPADNMFVKVNNIQLVITTTRDDLLYNYKSPIYFVEWEHLKQADVEQVDLFTMDKEIKERMKEVLLEEPRMNLVKQFLNITLMMSKLSDIVRIFSIFFGMKKTEEVFKMTEGAIVEIQNNHFCVAEFVYQFNFGSIISEVNERRIPSIVITDEYKIFSGIKGTEFVVLDKNCHSQLYSSLVSAAQSKSKKTFVIDASQLDNEIFDTLYFFLFMHENPKASTIFDQNELQIFRNYLDSFLTLEKSFDTLKSYINFIIVARDDNLDNLHEVFRYNMPVLRVNEHLKNDLRQAKNEYVDKLLKYTKLNISIFDKFTQDKQKILNEKTQEFISEMQSITQFFSNLTSLKQKLEMTFAPKQELKNADAVNQIENIEEKIKETQKKQIILQEQIKDFSSKLEEINKELEKILPNKLREVNIQIRSVDIEQQKRQLNKWISLRDTTIILSNAFKEIFGYISESSLADPSKDPEKTNLVHSVLDLDISRIDPIMMSKISRYLNNQDISYIIKENEITPVTDIEIIDYLIRWFNVIMLFVEKNKIKHEISNELSNLRNRIRLNNEFLDGLTQAYKASPAARQREDATECPQWLLQAYKNDSDEVKKLFVTLEAAEQIVNALITDAAMVDKYNKNISAVQVAYQYGMCSQPLEIRKKILSDCHLSEYDNPFKLIDRRIALELLNSTKISLSFFTPTTSSNMTGKSLSDKTSQPFNTLVIFDQLFFRSVIDENDKVIDDNLVIFYDPQSIALQNFMIQYNTHHEMIYSSSDYKSKLIHSISQGDTIFAFIDDEKSGIEFIEYVRHLTLEIYAMHVVQYNDARRPANSSFKLLIFTSIIFEHPCCIFADYSADKLENTSFFEHIVCSTMNNSYFDELMKELRNLTSKNSDFLTAMRRLVELSRDSWPEYFEKDTKMLTLRSNLEGFINLDKSILDSVKQIRDIEKRKSDYYKLDFLLRNCISMSNEKHNVFQLISAMKLFMQAYGTQYVDQQNAILKVEEIILIYLNFMDAHQRITFLANFEFKFLSEFLMPKDFLIENQFPKIHERNVNPLLPQIINHILQSLSDYPRSYFITSSRETIHYNKGDFPSVIIVDDLIPCDFIARELLSEPRRKTYIVSSFTIQQQNDDFIIKLFNTCIKEKSKFVVVHDQDLPKWVISSVIYMSNKLNFVDFSVVVLKQNLDKIPVIPHAVYISFSRPFTNSGVVNFLSEFTHQNVNESMHYCGPYLLFNVILSHRNDFAIPFQQILPTVNASTPFFDEGHFSDFNHRDLWKNIISSFIETYSGDAVTRNSLRKQIEYFFKSNEPSIPGISHVDSQSSIFFASEVPPSFNNCCMMCSFGDIIVYKEKNQNWQEKVKNFHFYVQNPEIPKTIKIEHCKLSNAFINQDELTIVGSDEMTIYASPSPVVKTDLVTEQIQNTVVVPIYDQDIFIGNIEIVCSGTRIQWEMTSVRLFLPQ